MPKTGIEYPYLRERPKFKDYHKEFEACTSYNVRFLNLITFQ